MTNQPRRLEKGPAKTSEEDANKKTKHNTKNVKRTCPLNGPVHDMNFFNVIQVHAKSMKATWSFDHGGVWRVKFAGAKMKLSDGKYLNMLVASSVAKTTKSNRNKQKAEDDSNSDNSLDIR